MPPRREDNSDHRRRRHVNNAENEDPRRKRGSDRSIGAAMALAFSAGALVFAGASALYSWYTQETAQRDQGYYCLPPRDSDTAGETGAAAAFKSSFLTASAAADGARETAAKDVPSHSSDALSEGCGVSFSGEVDGGHPCVCCLERHQSFMFVQCRHICLCEPCLIQLGRAYEDNKLRAHFDGPVRMPCPVCRTVGYIVKIFAS